MKSTVSVIQEKMEDSKEPNQEGMQSRVEHQGCPQGTCRIETYRRNEVAAQGPTSNHRAPRSAEGKDPWKLWIPEEIDCRRQKDDPLCRSGTVQGTQSWRTVSQTRMTEESGQGQSCKRNLERTDAWEETADLPGRHQWNQELKFQGTVTFWKWEDIQWDLQEDCQAGDHKANSWIFCQTSKNEGLDIAEESTPSKTVKGIAHKVGAGHVGALVTVGSFAHTILGEGGWWFYTCANLHLIRKSLGGAVGEKSPQKK
jgi:hypothetical protein